MQGHQVDAYFIWENTHSGQEKLVFNFDGQTINLMMQSDTQTLICRDKAYGKCCPILSCNLKIIRVFGPSIWHGAKCFAAVESFSCASDDYIDVVLEAEHS